MFQFRLRNLKQGFWLLFAFLMGLNSGISMDVVEDLEKGESHSTTDKQTIKEPDDRVSPRKELKRSKVALSDKGKKEQVGLKEVTPLLDPDKPLTDLQKLELGKIAGREFRLHAILLFAGRDTISDIIRFETSSLFSHCGLWLKAEKINSDEADTEEEDWCLESTGSPDQILKKKIPPHVQINPLKDVRDNYDGLVAYRELVFTKTGQKKNTSANLVPILHNYLGTLYEMNPLELLRALHKGNKTTDLKTIFCSELDAAVLMDLGLLGKNEVSDNYLPVDFSTMAPTPLQLKHCTAGPEVMLKVQYMGTFGAPKKKKDSSDNGYCSLF